MVFINGDQSKRSNLKVKRSKQRKSQHGIDIERDARVSGKRAKTKTPVDD
jgi:hypothetical protein